MTDDEVLSEFRASGALLEGHFLLSSGRHSAHYLQCARVLMNPERAGRLALALVQGLPRDLRAKIDKVVSPAMGGVIIGHEVGRALGRDAILGRRLCVSQFSFRGILGPLDRKTYLQFLPIGEGFPRLRELIRRLRAS